MKQYTQQQIKFISENFQQGQKAIQIGNFNRAERHYLDILKIAPEIIDAKNALAFVYSISKQHTKAIMQLEDLLKINANDANAHHNLANNLSENHQYNEAANHYQTAIKLNPNFVDSYTQCGLVQRKLKNFDLAVDYFNKALNLDKSNAKALHGLGITYAGMAEHSGALECLKKAVELTPDNMEFNLSLAKALENAELYHEADIQYHHTCSKFPNFLDAFLAYGDLLTKNRYFDEALECYNHAHKLAPEKLDILDDIGNTYLGMADTEKAIDNFNAALAIEPNRISSLVGLEKTYLETGKLELATNICNQIISIDASQPIGYILKSKVRKNKSDERLAGQLLQFADQQDLLEEYKTDIHFALGKIFDDQNNYQQAFKHYAIGNTLRNKKLNYDAEEDKSKFSKSIEAYDVDFFIRHQHIGVESDLPVVIVGMPRSATTLTEQIISSHPDVLAAGEATFWPNTIHGLRYTLNSQSDYPDCLADIQASHAKDIAAKYEQALAKISGAKSMPKHITDKMPHNFLNIGLIALLFPNAKIIHTKRDPIDTCLSIYFQNFNDAHPYAFELTNLGTHYRQYLRIMEHWHKVLPGRILDINYADTIANPEYWTRKLIDHIGLEWNDACLAPHKLERSVKTASHWQVRQPIYKTSVQRWKNYEEFLQPLIDALND